MGGRRGMGCGTVIDVVALWREAQRSSAPDAAPDINTQSSSFGPGCSYRLCHDNASRLKRPGAGQTQSRLLVLLHALQNMLATLSSVCDSNYGKAPHFRSNVERPAAVAHASSVVRPRCKAHRIASSNEPSHHSRLGSGARGFTSRPQQRGDVSENEPRQSHLCAASSSSPAAEKAASVLTGSAAELPITAVLNEIVESLEGCSGLVLQVSAAETYGQTVGWQCTRVHIPVVVEMDLGFV